MELLKLITDAEKELKDCGAFEKIEDIAFNNQIRVMESFRRNRVSEAHFAGTTGYGYDDMGRDTLDRVYAEVFECDAAFVRHNIISGTQCLTIGLFGLLRPGDTLLSATGKPYDTLEEVIGIRGERGNGSLADFGVKYDDIPYDGQNINLDALAEKLKTDNSIKVVFIQRSKGYSVRKTLSAKEIGEAASLVHSIKPDVFVAVDNCYGEFCDQHEPTYYGADLCMGSLIKNPGGGMADCGGYIAGTARAVELCSYRLTAPGVGLEAGASLYGNTRNMFKGLFYAPHTVCEAVKTAVLCAKVFEKLGFTVYPQPCDERHCIIQTVSLETRETLLAFCKGIQSGAPVDSHVTPEPWDMPGYAVPVIMAAGAFVGGASIELSADAPCTEPFTVYMQGGLTYQSGKLGVMYAAKEVLELLHDKKQAITDM